jgi:hypothetical protein
MLLEQPGMPAQSPRQPPQQWGMIAYQLRILARQPGILAQLLCKLAQ